VKNLWFGRERNWQVRVMPVIQDERGVPRALQHAIVDRELCASQLLLVPMVPAWYTVRTGPHPSHQSPTQENCGTAAVVV
jgi:hypothetical protein